MSTESVETLERRALEQRNRLHKTAVELKAELKSKIEATRDKFDLAKNAREHMTGACVVLGLLGLLSGYGFAGVFTRN